MKKTQAFKNAIGILVLAMAVSFMTGSALAIEEKIAVTGITVVDPNGGEIWPRGTSHEIKWSSTGNPGSDVKIELWKGNILYKTISASTANDGSYMWSIPYNYIIGSKYKIKVKSTTASYQDMSDGYFTIAGIDVIKPNGGEIWPRGTDHEIKWTYVGNPGPNVRIELWKGNQYYKTIAMGTANDGSYTWSIPYGVKIDSNYKIKIYSITKPVYQDKSNNYYTIAGINVDHPNGGEIWPKGMMHHIDWSYKGNPGPNVKIELWKGGTLHHVITSSTPNDGTYTWMIPNNQQTGNNYKVKIQSTSNSIYWDQSDKYYTIS